MSEQGPEGALEALGEDGGSQAPGEGAASTSRPIIVYEPGMAPGYVHFGGAARVPDEATGFPKGYGSARRKAIYLRDDDPVPLGAPIPAWVCAGAAAAPTLAARPPAPDPLQAGLEAIRARDPAFDLEHFLEDAQRTFFIVQKAWGDRNPDLSRQVMTDSLFQQHRMQIQDMIDRHVRDVMAGLALAGIVPIAAAAEVDQDWIETRIRAGCSDEQIDDRTNRTVSGDGRFKEWFECWTFNRPPGSKSDVVKVLQSCPTCGAPLETDIAGICSYCQSPVFGSDHGWRVARISRIS